MNAKASLQQPDERSQLKKGIIKRVWQLVGYIISIGAIFFLSAGTFNWLGAWVYLGLYVLGILINGLLLLRINPELIAERAQVRPDTKDWDRIVTRLALLFTVSMFVVSGLDQRFGWSPAIPLGLWLVIVVIFSLSSAFSSWAMIANAYFSTTVAIQKDRGHSVVTGGPYRLVRHPAYSGWLINTLVTPLVLGSLWALIPAALQVINLVVRTALEDRTLQEELEGYRAYSGKVRYRLAPGIW